MQKCKQLFLVWYSIVNHQLQQQQDNNDNTNNNNCSGLSREGDRDSAVIHPKIQVQEIFS